VERAALIPAFSRREKETMRRESRRVESGIGWNEARRLAQMGIDRVATGGDATPSPSGRGLG
jgi:hypothetical protein